MPVARGLHDVQQGCLAVWVRCMSCCLIIPSYSQGCRSGIIMEKVNVNGRHASPVWNFLKRASGDLKPIPWK